MACVRNTLLDDVGKGISHAIPRCHFKLWAVLDMLLRASLVALARKLYDCDDSPAGKIQHDAQQRLGQQKESQRLRRWVSSS